MFNPEGPSVLFIPKFDQMINIKTLFGHQKSVVNMVHMTVKGLVNYIYFIFLMVLMSSIY